MCRAAQVSDISEKVNQLNQELRKCQSSLDMELGAVGGAPTVDIKSLSQSEVEKQIVELLRSKHFDAAVESVSSLRFVA